jgi:hypothetical protein
MFNESVETTESTESTASAPAAGRRQFLRTAAGVLVPSAIGLAVRSSSAAEPPATTEARRRRRKRRSHQRPPQMFADDVVANFRSDLWYDVSVRFHTYGSRARVIPLKPHEESGFNRAIAPEHYLTDLRLVIYPDKVWFPGSWHYGIDFDNDEIGTPEVSVYRLVSGTNGDSRDRYLLQNHDLSENGKVSCDDGVVRVNIHRWTDGTIAEDEHDEEYCRFYATIEVYR